jgi:hypothetical protein
VVVDALRGACFVFMTMDHYPGNPFARFSNAYYGPFGFFTAALGFVFLSGLVAGLVYERHCLAYGTRPMVRRILRRIRDLYVTQVAVFLVLAAALLVGLGNVARWHLDLMSESPWRGLAFGSLLLYEPGYLGILPMYCLFLLLTPIVLWQFRKGHSPHVLIASALLWITSGLAMGVPANPDGVDFGAFSPLGYQLPFLVGLAFGTGELSIERLPSVTRKWLFSSSFVVGTAFFVLRQDHALNGPFSIPLNRLEPWFTARQLGPLRLLSFAAFALIVYWICCQIQWENVRSAMFQWLAFIGRHSLPVFAWSILVTYAALEFFPPHPDRPLGLVGVIVAVASLTIPARVRAMIRRRESLPPARSIVGALHFGGVQETPWIRRTVDWMTRPIASARAGAPAAERLERYAGAAASRETATITPTSIGRSSDLRR